jgi:uncharacterized protein
LFIFYFEFYLRRIIMRIIAFGDIHMSLGKFKNIPGLSEADLVIITGDLTNYGNHHDARKILDEVLSFNPNLLAQPGNLDEHDVTDYLRELNYDIHGTGRIFPGCGIMGVGGSNKTPFNTPNEFSEEEITGLLEKGYEIVKEVTPLILVSHTPPVNTKTDRISAGVHVGSQAIRNFIEEKQPGLCITGHIHEAITEDQLGECKIINPGMIKDGGWVEVNIAYGKIQADLRLL